MGLGQLQKEQSFFGGKYHGEPSMLPQQSNDMMDQLLMREVLGVPRLRASWMRGQLTVDKKRRVTDDEIKGKRRIEILKAYFAN